MAAIGIDSVDSSSSASNILVVIRCRPLNDREKLKQAEDFVKILESTTVIVKDPGHFADNIMRQKRVRERQFAFDCAFNPTSNTQQVFEATTARLVRGVVQGLNATVFAYGPTGTGKTHTMLGTPKDPGIMVRRRQA